MCLRKCPIYRCVANGTHLWPYARFGVGRRSSYRCRLRRQNPRTYRRELIPDYDEVREVCLNGGAATLWISGSGSTLMAVTDDGLVAESLRARLQSMHPDFQVHVECDTQGVRIQLA